MVVARMVKALERAHCRKACFLLLSSILPHMQALHEHIVIAGALTGSLFLLVRRVLLAVQKLQWQFGYAGARRIEFRIGRGRAFATDMLDDQDRQHVRGTVLMLWAFDGCMCNDLVQALPRLSKAYRRIRFVVCLIDSWPGVKDQAPGIPTISHDGFIKQFGVAMAPYAIKAHEGVIIECGVVNTVDHLESILAVESAP